MTANRMSALQSAAERTARILLRRTDVRVVVGGEGASYNGATNTLTVPAYGGDVADPVLMNAWRGLLDHECGHAEHTDFGVLGDHLRRWEARHGVGDAVRMKEIANVYEDLWMERAWTVDHKGSRVHLDTKRRYYHAKTGGKSVTDPAYTPKGGRTMGAFGALLQALLRVGNGLMTIDEVHPDTRLVLLACKAAIEEGWSAFSTDEACKAAEATWAAIEAAAEPPPSPVEPPPSPVEGQPLSVEGQPVAALCAGGDWTPCPTEGEVIGNEYLRSAPSHPYTVHPAAAATDKVKTFDAHERFTARVALGSLRAAAGPSAAKLAGMMQSAIKASKQAFRVGGLEDGDDLDDDYLVDVALGRTPRFASDFRAVSESAYVGVLVDCSGSMGSSATTWGCAACNTRASAAGVCSTCGASLRPQISSKAGYAAATAIMLHDALRACRVPHFVAGYTTCRGGTRDPNPCRADGRRTWSRAKNALCTFLFVPDPGLHDDGAALPYIDGHNNNLDGESVMWAARYAAEHGRDYDRVILFVVADGFPSGADDHMVEADHLADTVERVAQAGIEVYGVGIGMGSQWSAFQRFYPDNRGGRGRAPTGHVRVDAVAGLTDNLLREMTALLTRGYGTSRRAKAGR